MPTVNEDVILKLSTIRNKFVELDLKQWWVAEQIGVDRKTVNRWLQGKVKFVKRENAKSLARILNLELKDIIVHDEAEQFATTNDQKEAAKLLMESDVLNSLAPIGEWNVVEQLIKSNLVPNLPLKTLAQMYSQLSVACWRQSKIDIAKTYANKALQIAEKLNDMTIIVGAKLSLANIASWNGNLPKAISMYEFCVDNGQFLETQKLRATALSNLGAVYWEAGDFKKSKDYQNQALSIYGEIGEGMNLSISNGHLAMVELEDGNVDRALKYAEEAKQWAIKANYKRGIQMETLTIAEVHAHKKNKRDAVELMEKALNGFSKLGIEEGFNYNIAGRILRLLGSYNKAEHMYKKALVLNESFPLEKASVFAELFLLALARNQAKDAENYKLQAIEIYSNCGAVGRVRMLK